MKFSKFNKQVRRLVCALFSTLSFGSMTTASAAERSYRLMTLTSTMPVVDQVNNITDFFSTLFKAVGVVMGLIGVAMLGKSFYTHDTSERPRAIEFIVGALIFASSGVLVNFIMK